MEIWKELSNYNGRIEISNMGNIRSHKTHRNLKTSIKNNGYKKVSITYKNISKTYVLHRLVAYYFISNPENKPQVNHKDGNKLNNHVENLEWCTISENMKHAFKKGLNKISWSKIVLNIETGIFYDSVHEASISINKKKHVLGKRLNGTYKNNTKFILV